MNLQELNELDINDIASWPSLAKGILIAFICALIGGAGYYALISDCMHIPEQSGHRFRHYPDSHSAINRTLILR